MHVNWYQYLFLFMKKSSNGGYLEPFIYGQGVKPLVEKRTLLEIVKYLKHEKESVELNKTDLTSCILNFHFLPCLSLKSTTHPIFHPPPF